jgi:hypothetical protein
MEVALFCAVMGRTLEALARVRDARARSTREARTWQLGAWGAALVLIRPEAALLVGVFGAFAARGAGHRSGILAVLRASLPGALATGAAAGANLLATGDARSAGARLKLLSSNPYLSDVDRARVFVENLVTFWLKVVRGEVAVVPALLFVLPALALAGLFQRDRRAVVAASLTAAGGWILLVSWNGNAPYHNFRYYAPALVLVTIAAAIGLSVVARVHRRRGAMAAGMLAAFAALVSAAKIPGQVRHFRSASANIRDQHIEIGERLARLPGSPASITVLLGDAGAIPYVSHLAAVDALGLGGYRGVPFVSAAVYGEPATIELIERLDPALRPTHFALYPNWFGALTSRFGVEIDRVTIQGNVICGSPTKAIYRADWSALASEPTPPRTSLIDELDVADVIDEADHAYAPPLPHGGWTTLDVLRDGDGPPRFDGGRTIPDGASESFTVRRGSAGAVTLRVRVDGEARGIVVRTEHAMKELSVDPKAAGVWRSASTSLERVDAGERITLEARGGAYRDYHVWLERDAKVSR